MISKEDFIKDAMEWWDRYSPDNYSYLLSRLRAGEVHVNNLKFGFDDKTAREYLAALERHVEDLINDPNNVATVKFLES